MTSESLRRELTSTILALEAAADYHRASVDASADGNGETIGFMSTNDAAATLGLSPRRIRQLLSSGSLRGRSSAGRWEVEAASVGAYKGSR